MARDARERWITAPLELAEASTDGDAALRANGAPELERDAPACRAARLGAQALSEAELLALLLGPRRTTASVLALALDLLARVGGLRQLLRLEVPMLQRLGLSHEAAFKLHAVAEIRRRVALAEIEEATDCTQPSKVGPLLASRYEHETQEVMGALFLNHQRRLLALRELFRGGRARIVADNDVILREALLLRASKIVLFHTHPSGDLTPSVEDIHFTRRFAAAVEPVGLTLLDHLILGCDGRWRSLRDRVAF